jgi:NarL family two-component system response regulator YdfI
LNPPLRVLLVDDQPVVREGLRLFLESDSGFEVAGEASDGAEALAAAERLPLDVILMDMRAPGMNGLEAMRRIRQSRPDARIVVLTTYGEDELMAQAIQAGASGYLLKDVKREALLDTVRAASRGEALVRSEVLARLLVHGGPPRFAPPSSGRSPALSDRERQVLDRVAQGERNKEIARCLGISERTVKAHLASVFNKLGVETRAAAVSIALQRGLLVETRAE